MIRLLQLTDCHLLPSPEARLVGVQTERTLEEVLTAVQRHPFWPPAALLLTGDLVHRPALEVYRRLQAKIEPLGIPYMALPGNHDDPKLLWQVMPRSCLELGRWQVVGLSSWQPEGKVVRPSLSGSEAYAGLLAPEELVLLEEVLRESHRPTLIALHHPPVEIESPWMDEMGLLNREDFWRIVERFPQVKAVVFGHIHQEFHHHHRGIDLWGTPSTCFQFRPYSERLAIHPLPPGWRWLVLHDEGVVTTEVGRLPNLPEGLELGYRSRKNSGGSAT